MKLKLTPELILRIKLQAKVKGETIDLIDMVKSPKKLSEIQEALNIVIEAVKRQVED